MFRDFVKSYKLPISGITVSGPSNSSGKTMGHVLVPALIIAHLLTLEMADQLTLSDFQRWKVPELREYLKKRGLKTSAKKDELTALAFAAFKVIWS